MQRLTLRLFVVLLTFAIGVSLTALWAFRPYYIERRNHQEQASAKVSAWLVLHSFLNQDLTKLDAKSRVAMQEAVKVLLGKRSDFSSEHLVPRLISEITNSKGEKCYVFIEEFPLVEIPGSSGLHVHEFNLAGQFLRSANFSVGYRMDLTETKIMNIPELDREVITVRSQPVFNFAKQYEKQYYALIGDDVLLVRFEDGNGRMIRNDYDPTHFTIGHTIIGRPAEAWEQALNSQDTAEVLSTLTWLSGRHRKPGSSQLGPTDEELSESILVNNVRLNSGVKLRLESLTHAENAWVREAANSALKVEDH